MPEIANIAWLLQNLKPEFGPFIAQITQSLRSDPKAYNWESLTANLLNKVKRLQVADKSTKSIQIVRHKGKKYWKKNKKVPFYKYYKLTSYKKEDFYFLYPNKAPKG